MARKSVSSSILQIHLPERWPEGASFSAPLFHWARYDGAAARYGASRLEEIGPARQVIAVAPANRVLFTRARLPHGRAAREPKILRNAVEDSLVSGLDDVHAVPLETLPGGESLIAVVDLRWVKSVYDELAAHHLTPTRLITEGELLAGAPATRWTLVRSAAGGFVHTGGYETVAVDGSIESSRDEIPLTLNLLLDERTQAGTAPEEIVVYSSQSSLMPDAEQWTKALAVKVSYAGPWQPEKIDARSARHTDLLPGAGIRKGAEQASLARYRPAIYIAAATVVLHLGLSSVDWWRLHREAGQIRASMETRFRKTFPDAKFVPDPVLQMSRNLDALHRASGALQGGDYIALFGRIAPQLAAAGAQARSAKYERGQLALDLVFSGNESIESLGQRLRASGIRVSIDHVASAAAGSGTVASIRVTPEGSS